MAAQVSIASIPRTRWYRVLPVVFIMFTVAYMDRQNISIALPSISKDLALTPGTAGIIAGIPFWGYVVVNVLAGPIILKFGIRRTVFAALILWGLFAIVSGFVQNGTQLLVSRLLLGAAEGPAWTGGTVLVMQWFPSRERGRATGLWNLCVPAGIVIGSIAGGFLVAHYSWRAMFVVEGLPAWIWAVVWMIFIRERPADAEWLPADEREYIETATAAEQRELAGQAKAPWSEVLSKGFVWIVLAGYVCWTLILFGFTFWLPTALKSASTLGIQNVALLSAIPFIAGGIGMVLVQWDSDRTLERKFHTGIPLVLMGIFLILAVTLATGNFWLSMVFFVLVGLCAYATFSVMFVLLTENLSRGAATVAIGFINGVGSIGAFFGPTLVGFLNGATHSFVFPFMVLGSIGILGGILFTLAPVRRAVVAVTVR